MKAIKSKAKKAVKKRQPTAFELAKATFNCVSCIYEKFGDNILELRENAAMDGVIRRYLERNKVSLESKIDTLQTDNTSLQNRLVAMRMEIDRLKLITAEQASRLMDMEASQGSSRPYPVMPELTYTGKYRDWERDDTA